MDRIENDASKNTSPPREKLYRFVILQQFGVTQTQTSKNFLLLREFFAAGACLPNWRLAMK
jgi:hypothetical protein